MKRISNVIIKLSKLKSAFHVNDPFLCGKAGVLEL